MIQTSCIETDPMRKDELVKKAMDNLLIDPTKFDMESVVPDLVKNKQFQQIIHLCLAKIKQVPLNDDRAAEVRDLLDLIVQIVDALDTTIVGETKVVDS